jgi:hypothetical protein
MSDFSSNCVVYSPCAKCSHLQTTARMNTKSEIYKAQMPAEGRNEIMKFEKNLDCFISPPGSSHAAIVMAYTYYNYAP